MEPKAQAAMEYMVITGISLLILLVLLNTAYRKVGEMQKQADLDAAERAVNKLKEAADFVYVHGHPSKLTIEVYLPGGVYAPNTYVSGNTINLALGQGDTYTDVWRGTKGPVEWDAGGNTTMPSVRGYYVITVESGGPLLGGVINVHE